MFDWDDEGDFHGILRVLTGRETNRGARMRQETGLVELENDFAEVLARLHHAMGRRRVCGWYYFVNRRTQFASLKRSAELLEERRDDLRFLRERAAAQGRAEDF